MDNFVYTNIESLIQLLFLIVHNFLKHKERVNTLFLRGHITGSNLIKVFRIDFEGMLNDEMDINNTGSTL